LKQVKRQEFTNSRSVLHKLARQDLPLVMASSQGSSRGVQKHSQWRAKGLLARRGYSLAGASSDRRVWSQPSVLTQIIQFH